jgi:hypothetical protein
MFQQLVPRLRQRSVLLTVTSLEDDQIRVKCHQGLHGQRGSDSRSVSWLGNCCYRCRTFRAPVLRTKA